MSRCKTFRKKQIFGSHIDSDKSNSNYLKRQLEYWRYWKEELTEQETSQLFQTIKQKKWTEILGLYTMLQNGVCIREQLLQNFDEQLTNHRCALLLQVFASYTRNTS